MKQCDICGSLTNSNSYLCNDCAKYLIESKPNTLKDINNLECSDYFESEQMLVDTLIEVTYK